MDKAKTMTLLTSIGRDNLIVPGDFAWQRRHSDINQWISEFEFYERELEFLQRVLLKSSPWEIDHKTPGPVTDLITSLDNLEFRRNLLLRVIKYHRTQVESVIINPFVYDGQPIRQDHRDIEKRIAAFESDLRHKKSAIYQFVEGAVKADRLPHLLDTRYESD